MKRRLRVNVSNWNRNIVTSIIERVKDVRIKILRDYCPAGQAERI